MFVETLEKFPEEMRADFVETEFEGKKGFMHKTDEALMNSLKNAKSEREQAKKQYEEVNTRLSDFEKNQKEAIEKARAEALEDAISKGDAKAVEERYQQQMADLEKRVREETRSELEKELTTKQAADKASSLADNIGLTLGIDKEDGLAIADLIRNRVKIDPNTGKEIYHDAQGSALSVDRSGFEAELKKEARFKRLIKAELITKGGGFVNGSDGKSSAESANVQAQDAKKKGDLNGFLKAHLSN